MRTARFLVVAGATFLMGADRGCWIEARDTVASHDRARVYRARLFHDVNLDSVYTPGVDTPRANELATATLAIIDRDGAALNLASVPLTSGLDGIVTFDATSFMNQMGLYRFSLSDASGLQDTILRQYIPQFIDSVSPGSEGGREVYCVAYKHQFAREVVHARLNRANFASLTAFQSFATIFAGADLVEASAVAAMQRNLGFASLRFNREASPSFVPGQQIQLGALCSVDNTCAADEMCELVFPPHDSEVRNRCVKVAPCTLRPRNGFYRKHVEFTTNGDTSGNPGDCGRARGGRAPRPGQH